MFTSLAVIVSGCARTVPGTAVPAGKDSLTGGANIGQYDKLLSECTVVDPATIARIVGGHNASSTFSGAICRWLVTGGVTADVTFIWLEWGTMQVEKQTAHRLGFTTDNIQVSGSTAFTMRDPRRPAVCGITANSPNRGVLTWWVEPRAASVADPCAAPTALMKLVVHGGQ